MFLRTVTQNISLCLADENMARAPRQIVWDDLDKRKYYFWGCTVFLGIRTCVYPTNLVKTRLQVQKGTAVYRGSFDAFVKVRLAALLKYYFYL